MTQGVPAGRGRAAERGRLLARPTPPAAAASAAPPGLHALGLTSRRDGLLYVPARLDPARPAPLALMLHGAGGDARGILSPFLALADAAGALLLAPVARLATWDAVLDGFGPDVTLIDRALAQTFARHAVDPARVAAAGFSDGASYALSLGLANGDLFTHVLAFSPGFMRRPADHGRPAIYVSHGTGDAILPIDLCGRRLVALLRHADYDVRYREFDGPHTVPPAVAAEAFAWFTGDAG